MFANKIEQNNHKKHSLLRLIEKEVKESERQHKLMQYELQQQAEFQVKEATAVKEAMARELKQYLPFISLLSVN